TIFGFGGIGQACGRRLRALGADVTGVRRSVASSDAADRVVPTETAMQALSDADVVLLCLPLTNATEDIANAAFFAQMKPGSLLINVGRGGLVDEAALFEALENGCPAQAYLDVVREEPLPSDSPIWDNPNIVLTPHISALTEGSAVRTDSVFLENIENFLAGVSLKNRVDPDEFA
ncbi:MAG: NAD(P)-dependent oxidoreductase, partial [Pseudomonadota bacterium]